MPEIETILFLALAAFAAGWVDSVVGGGGLIQLPALLLVPGIAPVQALATNKLASFFGTSISSVTYYRALKPDLTVAIPTGVVALLGAIFGASVAVILPKEIFLPIILLTLIVVAVITTVKPKLGQFNDLKITGVKQRLVAGLIGLVIGFYDGVLGPGTGTFLVIALVGIIGFNFLNASAHAKIINLATNFGALILFIPYGVVMWKLGFIMAVFNMLGSFLGSRTAIARGSKFVRIAFLLVVSALIVKLSIDVFANFGQ